ncbi:MULTISPECIES: hypothetical protein [Halorussus]|uniref:hypothetical protein n=1 Tax=Halorussus TaxID=1070314 RepID=UPI000E20CCDC|nr:MULTISPECIES: hypothetical protein [Halorussus]NHN58440.1 hypothetical protein [Halorussus sp. JP-T4]
MKRLLNEHTGTLHRLQPGSTGGSTACGALRHVPRRYVTTVGTDDALLGEDVERCGRCFEDAGGY